MSNSKLGAFFEFSVSDADKATFQKIAETLKLKERDEQRLRSFQGNAAARIEQAKLACAERRKRREAQAASQ